MEIRMWRLTSGLSLALLALGLGGCQLLGSEKSSEANDSASNTPETVIPAEKVEAQSPTLKETPKSAKVIAAVPLTIPTDPDARIKAIRKGRSNPFAQLVSPKPKNPQVSPNQARPALNPAPKPPKKVAAAPKPPSRPQLPRLSAPGVKPEKSTGEIVLPPLPEPALAKQVTVQGVVVLGGQPKAILKAPNESVARTVKAGDYLANGQILVSSIDVSNPQSPRIILKESGQTVTVGVGQSADAQSASLPS